MMLPACGACVFGARGMPTRPSQAEARRQSLPTPDALGPPPRLAGLNAWRRWLAASGCVPPLSPLRRHTVAHAPRMSHARGLPSQPPPSPARCPKPAAPGLARLFRPHLSGSLGPPPDAGPTPRPTTPGALRRRWCGWTCALIIMAISSGWPATAHPGTPPPLRGRGGHRSATPSQPRSPADPCLLGGRSNSAEWGVRTPGLRKLDSPLFAFI